MRRNPTRLVPPPTGTVFTRPAPPLYAFCGGDDGGGGPTTTTPAAWVSPATAARVTDPAARAAYWDAFYARNGTRFFKDRHWLGREFGAALAGAAAVLEVGCGVGNAALMLLGGGGGGEEGGGGDASATDPAAATRIVYACDFAPCGVDLMVERAGRLGVGDRLAAFVADATAPGALVGGGAGGPGVASASPVRPASLDAATLLFALSAMPPGPAMRAAVSNVAATLKPGGVALVRDYCGGDLAQARLAAKAGGRRVGLGGDGTAASPSSSSTNTGAGGLFMRGDGTLAYYFDGPAELASLFEGAGFVTRSARVVEATKVNRATGVAMPRRWVQGVFEWVGEGCGEAAEPPPHLPGRAGVRRRRRRRAYQPEWERDAATSSSSSSSSDGDEGGGAPSSSSSTSSSSSGGAARAAARLLSGLGEGGGDPASPSAALPPLEPVTLDLPPPLGPLAILAAPGELRNTTGHTGLLVWGSAPALAAALLGAAAAAGGSLPFLRAGAVLEVGCGSAPALALAALAAGAPRYVATDGSPVALALWARNFGAHAWRVVAERARARWLAWGEGRGGEAALAADHTPGGAGFATILGADVLYSAPAVPRLMATVAAALAQEPAAVALFCLQVRGVSLEAVAGHAASVGLVAVPPPACLAVAAAAGGVGRPGDLLQLVAFGWGDGERGGGERRRRRE